MIFDKNTLVEWETRGINNVSCFLIARGCAGEKLQVEEGIVSGMDQKIIGQNGIIFHTRTSEADFFKDIYITHSGSKWIVSGGEVNVHCGCGSSFSRKSGNAIIDRVRRMREIIRRKKEKSHQ